ncbi:Enolase [Labeo rohita]|uniref:Enolase n=1 Tax=Labeo rohita TaxID=84645 RepID=A0ABQ8L3F3_LABRO|nr:Enolase [Labeo rohita]
MKALARELPGVFGLDSVKNLIAKISGETSEIDDGPDGRFRDRLKLDHQIGSLTIINIRTEHAGVYEVDISRRSSETEIRFTVTLSVFGDTGAVESVSVMEGKSVTLQSNVTELQMDDERIRTFGTKRNLIAKTSGS